jgi:CRISPR-associated protein (TIGR02710 family)
MSEPSMSFQEQLERFRARTTAHRGHYQAIILPGTRQHMTAALLIGGLEPERVAFLLTEQTRDMPEKVARELVDVVPAPMAPQHNWFIPSGHHATTDTVYHGIKQVLEHWHDVPPTAIAVDVTGGFALMSVGIAKAAHVLRLTTIYILSDFNQETNRVIPGTQRLEFPPDPYTVFGDLEAAEARRLYRAHDYAGAQRIFADLSQRVPAPNNQPYRAYALLAQAYAAWDVFAWDNAAAALAALLESPFPSDLEAVRPQLQDQHTVLQQLTMDTDRWEKKPTLKLLQDQTSVLPLLGSLYANAQRREAQGRYDVAALFSYRCLELMSQHRLATWGLLTDQPDYRPLRRRIPDLDERYRGVEERLFDHSRGLPHWKSGISLFNGYMLLDALHDPLVQAVALEQIRERTRVRNQSMLAHGFRLITQTEYEQFRTVVDEILDRFFVVLKKDRPHWEQTYQFVCSFAAEETH